MIGSVTGQWAELQAIEKRRAQMIGHVIGAEAGPGDGLEPGHPDPGDADRPLLEDGHAAASPQHDPPRTSPIHHAPRGYLAPIEMPSAALVAGEGPLVTAMAAHHARAAAVRPPIPQGPAQ